MSPTARNDLQRPLKGAARCACFGTAGATAAAVPFTPPFVAATASKLTALLCKHHGQCLCLSDWTAHSYLAVAILVQLDLQGRLQLPKGQRNKVLLCRNTPYQKVNVADSVQDDVRPVPLSAQFCSRSIITSVHQLPQLMSRKIRLKRTPAQPPPEHSPPFGSSMVFPRIFPLCIPLCSTNFEQGLLQCRCIHACMAMGCCTNIDLTLPYPRISAAISQGRPANTPHSTHAIREQAEQVSRVAEVLHEGHAAV